MLAIVFVVALLAASSAIITENTATTEAAAPAISVQQWDAITAGLEYSGQAAAATAEATARQRDTGVVARPLPPPGKNGQTVMLDPLPPNSIIGKGAGLIQEKAPTGLTVSRHSR